MFAFHLDSNVSFADFEGPCGEEKLWICHVRYRHGSFGLRTFQFSFLVLQPLLHLESSSLPISNLFSPILFPYLPPLCLLTSKSASKQTTKVTGALGTHEYRCALYKDGKQVSPWHDIPLSQGTSPQGDRLVNMVMEIPKGTRAKLEMQPEEQFNPIGHDKTKSGEIRYMGYSPVLYNYGFIPQTWEDPNHIHEDTKLGGDNDPLDIIDIGYRRREVGEVYRVKIVGSFALIDEGETDWKILGISLDDPACKLINTVEDIETHKPGITHTLRDWYKKYKTADGKPENTFAFQAKIQDQVRLQGNNILAGIQF